MKFMTHGKRTRLIPSDVDNSLILYNIESSFYSYFLYYHISPVQPVTINQCLVPTAIQFPAQS
ncbi:hypothetical protein V9T40_013638 [Parthenolecanium corni]|uniref:Uncharacterized protein n=1 Tax=Parthenolecanium corni TaxID=536013 RepID=A0AAN9TBL8_9HEMI